MSSEQTCADVLPLAAALPPRQPLPEGASRDQVRKWLDLEAQRQAADVEHTFPAVALDHVGCIACHCGDVVTMHGPIGISPVIEAQQQAGEEDQSIPGWDAGA